jgi:hypothetical protein
MQRLRQLRRSFSSVPRLLVYEEDLTPAWRFEPVGTVAFTREIMPTIVGLTGEKGHGKDTVADHLVRHHGFVKLSFAGPLKDGVAAIFGFDRDRMEEDREYKEGTTAWGASPRHYLQWLGTDILRKHVSPDFFILRMEKELDEVMQQGKNVVISDARFDNEAEMIYTCGKRASYKTHLWKVDAGARLDLDADSVVSGETGKDTHASEAGIDAALVSLVLDNSSQGPRHVCDQADWGLRHTST